MENFNIKKKQLIEKGLSGDKKYYIETVEGQCLLLRISDIAEYDRKKTIFSMMKKAAELDIPMCRPIDFGICNENKSVYQLLTWCEGENLENVISLFSKTEQYCLGKKAGYVLRRIHLIPTPCVHEDWSERYFNTNNDCIKSFLSCGIEIDGSEKIIEFIENNKYLLQNRPQCFNHGDFHTGNLIVSSKRDIFVIDWELLDFNNYADPWHEFNRIGLSDVHPYFTTGLINGYFNGEPTVDFWRLLSFYLASGSLMLVSWAYYLQQDELNYAKQQVKNVLLWFNNMKNLVPTWYLNGEQL